MTYTEAILSNSTRTLLWFQITKILIAVLINNFTALFIIIFEAHSFPIALPRPLKWSATKQRQIMNVATWMATTVKTKQGLCRRRQR